MLKFVGFLIEAYAWLRIMLSPFLFGIILGVVVYSLKTDKFGLVLGITIALVGLVFGIIWAMKVRKKMRAIDFISRVNASPDLDKIRDE